MTGRIVVLGVRTSQQPTSTASEPSGAAPGRERKPALRTTAMGPMTVQKHAAARVHSRGVPTTRDGELRTVGPDHRARIKAVEAFIRLLVNGN